MSIWGNTYSFSHVVNKEKKIVYKELMDKIASSHSLKLNWNNENDIGIQSAQKVWIEFAPYVSYFIELSLNEKQIGITEIKGNVVGNYLNFIYKYFGVLVTIFAIILAATNPFDTPNKTIFLFIGIPILWTVAYFYFNHNDIQKGKSELKHLLGNYVHE